MSDDIEKEKKKVELDDLGRLVDKYAQSRSLGLLLPMALIVIIAILLIGVRELVKWKPAWWLLGILFLSIAGVSVGAIWLTFRLVNKYEYSFYRKDGRIELAREKIPIWAWVVFSVSFVGVAVLNELNIMPIRWALTLALVILGVFAFYISGKEKERPLGAVFCMVLLVEAVGIAAGVLPLFAGRHSYSASLMTYIVGAGLITAVVVHIYNRRILRKIKEMRPFGEQEPDKSDS